MASVDLKEALVNKFSSFEKSLNGHAATPLHQVRKQALEAFNTLGFPTIKHEEWKYTNVAAAVKADYTLAQEEKLTSADIEQFLIPGLEANILVFVNGVLDKSLSKIISSEKELIVKDLADAIDSETELVNQYLGKLTDNKTEAFTALSTAYAQHGAFIKVPDNKVVENPVLLLFIHDARQGNTLILPRNLFVVGKNAQVKVFENYHTLGTNISFTNAVTEIVVRQDAVVDYYKIQNDTENAHFVGTTQVKQVEKSVFSAVTITLSGGIIRNNLNLVLGAEHCEAHMYGLYMVDGNTHIDNHTVADHAFPNCESNELYKGVLNGSSTGVFNGKIFVRKDAQKTNAFQSNKNILLSQDASVNTKPQLEIFADDVKCSHGCTIGQLDDEALFYLRARGIGEESAKSLLVHAFAADVLSFVKIDVLSEYLDKLITERLYK